MEPVRQPDPLGFGIPLPVQSRFHPVGFPLVLRTNSGDVLAAARNGFGEFEPMFEAEPIELRVVVAGEDGPLPPAAHAGPSFAAQGHLVAFVLDSANYAICDLDRCFCFARLTPAVARDALYASFHFLDAMAYCCVTHRHATAIHAACVARDGLGILLIGESGAGKSSLAWACARAGFAYVSDDSTWLLRNSAEPGLVGKPQRIRFRPEVFDVLPELRRLPRLETVVGKRSFEIPTAEVPGFPTARRCRPWKLVFLDRRLEGPPALIPMPNDEARRKLAARQFLWEPKALAAQTASLERLAHCQACVLRYSDLAGAVRLLRELA